MAVVINRLINALFGLMIRPVRDMTPWVAMAIVSVLAGIMVLLVFRMTANPAAIRRRKDVAIARLLELVLFRDDILVSLGAFGRILIAQLAYLWRLVVPFCVSFVPVVILLIQAEAWLGSYPLRPGEQAVAKVRFHDGDVMSREIAITASDNLVVETPAVRIPGKSEINWRIRGLREGRAWLDIAVDGVLFRKDVVIGSGIELVSGRRDAGGFWTAIRNPAEPPLPEGADVESIEIAYASRDYRVGHMRFNWLFVFIVLTMVVGFALRKPLRVEL
ncbi:MAG: hypothetical protein E4H02_04765 [Lentisphaerales bacterium]|nr:MAG: hypothetical protein E4H02_04765 [Lentisphaerales bacterium]